MFFVKLSKQLLTLKIIFLNMVLNALVVGALHFEAVHGFLCFGYIDLVVISVGHGFSPFSLPVPDCCKTAFRRFAGTVVSISSGGSPSQFVAAIVL
jgi:hypothetical protein